jgi:hypothetical protein
MAGMSRLVAAGALLGVICGAAQVLAEPGSGLQVPRPFPGGPARPAEPARPAPPDTVAPVPDEPAPAGEVPPGTPVYPTAEFIDSFDAGSGQRYYLYGTNIPYSDIVAYYRNVLRDGGREVFRTPPMQQFDLGRFDDSSMAFPPSVVVKDYTWNGSPGYAAVSGTAEKRFRTVIQIVPATRAR